MIKFFRDRAKGKITKLLVAVIIFAFLCVLSFSFWGSSRFEESESSLVDDSKVNSLEFIERSSSSVSIAGDDVEFGGEIPLKRKESLMIDELEREVELYRKVNAVRTYPILLDPLSLKLKTDAKSILGLDEKLSTQVSSLLDALLEDVKRFESEGAEFQRKDSGKGVRVHIKGSESARDLMISNTYRALVEIVGLEKSNILRDELESALSDVGEATVYEFQSVMSDSMGESLEIKRFVGGEEVPSFRRTVRFQNTELYAETISRYSHLIEVGGD
jgi:hypothetical protein